MPPSPATNKVGPGSAPSAWGPQLAGYQWIRQPIGESQAGVFRLEADGRADLFVKAEPDGPFCEVADEADRLRWMEGRDLPAPRVLGQYTGGGHQWLLMTAVPGTDLASSPGLDAKQVVAIAAAALRSLHALPIADCPFDHRLVHRLAAAQARLEAGRVDANNFDDEHRGRTANELMSELQAVLPDTEVDLVVTHGDACLPNFLASAGKFSGYVDCARLGVADRYQDLALTAGSIGCNLGAEWIAAFFKAYGLDHPDPAKLGFYRTLDEFF